MRHEGGYLIYKCRNCGELIKNIHAPDGMKILFHLLYGYDVPKEWFGITPYKEEIHNCRDNNLGVADLIGFEFDENHDNKRLKNEPTKEEMYQCRLEAARYLDNLEFDE